HCVRHPQTLPWLRPFFSCFPLLRLAALPSCEGSHCRALMVCCAHCTNTINTRLEHPRCRSTLPIHPVLLPPARSPRAPRACRCWGRCPPCCAAASISCSTPATATPLSLPWIPVFSNAF